MNKLEFFSSGSQMVDSIIGRGWPIGRLCNVQGDSSSGKTYLAERAAAEHILKFPKGTVWYVDSEHAFDTEYAEKLKIPVDKINFIENQFTVEDWFKTLMTIKEDFDDSHGLMILDSLDALSDEAERAREIDEGSFGAVKAKKMSELFRRINAELNDKNISVLVVSQLRDALSSPIPGQKIRSGGKAIEFYSSIVVRLSTVGPIKKEKVGISRRIGSYVQVECTKNKVAMPFRKGKVNFIFGKGIDDTASCLEWLVSETGKLDGISRVTPIGTMAPSKANLGKFINKMKALPTEEYNKKAQEIATVTSQLWEEVEALFAEEDSTSEEETKVEE